MKNEFDYLNEVKMDFNPYEKEKKYMNNKKIIIMAACLAVFTLTTVFAGGFVGDIIKSISTGFNSFHQVDPEAPVELMDELKGKIFDADGNALDVLYRSDIDNIYDKDGNKITQEKFAEMIEEATGGLVVYSSNDDYDTEANKKDFETLEEAQQTAVFDIKAPDYLPDGYSLSRIFTYAEENGEASGEYLTIVYKNGDGKEITVMERILNENTAFEAGTDGTIEEITVNGRKAVIMNGVSLNFETEDSVSVGIYTHGNVSQEELIKIAESVK